VCNLQLTLLSRSSEFRLIGFFNVITVEPLFVHQYQGRYGTAKI